jgi:hypothetical protein
MATPQEENDGVINLEESDKDNEGRIQVVCRIRKMSEME